MRKSDTASFTTLSRTGGYDGVPRAVADPPGRRPYIVLVLSSA